jgi:hypothetical protein
MGKDLQRFNKQAYYYGEQLREYKTLFEDPKKVEKRAMTLLGRVPAYTQFLEQHSQLASLFGLPLNFNENRSIEGLQTRTQVEQLISQRVGSSPDARQAVSQQIDVARSTFDELKSKFPQLDNAGEMPEFKPKGMKTKTLWQRLKPGGNLQFQKSSRYFPTIADIAVQLAYKFHENGSLGAGISYKLGIGSGWNNVAFSHRGIGFRSFIDWKLKSSFYVNGGYEAGSNSSFKNIQELRNWNGWQYSALLGLSKKYRVNAKLKGNLIVFYDFLAPRQLPKSNNIKVRLGYTL